MERFILNHRHSSNYFSKLSSINWKVIEVMNSSDLADPVMAAFDVVKVSEPNLDEMKKSKSEIGSNLRREIGNALFRSGNYQKALHEYNVALAFAPHNSKSMLYAYSNRSALLFKINAFSACIIDIDICLEMEHSNNIRERLIKRKQECQNLMYQEKIKAAIIGPKFSTNIFEFKDEANLPLTNISSDISISDARQIVAKNDIRIGQALANEEAFVATIMEENAYLCCHYCSKMTMNLIPCDRCCSALFCDNVCKEQCLFEFHDIECDINILQDIEAVEKMLRLAIRSALKIKKLGNNWDEFISNSYNMGKERLKNSALTEIYDSNNKYSVLSFEENKHFIHCELFNGSIIIAQVLFFLNKIPSFFPSNPELKEEAKRAFARVVLKLFIYFPRLKLMSAAQDLISYTLFRIEAGQGYFPFTSKLKHSCDPNVIALANGKRLTLVAVKPITKGTEITFSNIGSWWEYEYETRRTYLYIMTGVVCRCPACLGDWDIDNLPDLDIKNKQVARLYELWDSNKKRQDVLIFTEEKFFKLTCAIMVKLQSEPLSQKHIDIYKAFQLIMDCLQHKVSKNYCIGTSFQKGNNI